MMASSSILNTSRAASESDILGGAGLSKQGGQRVVLPREPT
jgi:hypothetical protein